jgi:hypothetical protein
LLSLANGKLSGKSGIFSPLNDDENLVLQSVDDEFKKSETILRNILEGKRL